MFHRFITHGDKIIDFDRATWLMSKDLLDDAYDAVLIDLGMDPMNFHSARRSGIKFDLTCSQDVFLQKVWDAYCVLHEKGFKTRFDPDVM